MLGLLSSIKIAVAFSNQQDNYKGRLGSVGFSPLNENQSFFNFFSEIRSILRFEMWKKGIQQNIDQMANSEIT